MSQRSTFRCSGFLVLATGLTTMGTPVVAQEPYVVLQYNSDIYDSYSDATTSGAHVIARGETLYGILGRYFGPSADLSQLAQETVQRNPDAFLGGDMGRMLAGQTLVLPDAQYDQIAPDDIYFF